MYPGRFSFSALTAAAAAAIRCLRLAGLALSPGPGASPSPGAAAGPDRVSPGLPATRPIPIPPSAAPSLTPPLIVLDPGGLFDALRVLVVGLAVDAALSLSVGADFNPLPPAAAFGPRPGGGAVFGF